MVITYRNKKRNIYDTHTGTIDDVISLLEIDNEMRIIHDGQIQNSFVIELNQNAITYDLTRLAVTLTPAQAGETMEQYLLTQNRYKNDYNI